MEIAFSEAKSCEGGVGSMQAARVRTDVTSEIVLNGFNALSLLVGGCLRRYYVKVAKVGQSKPQDCADYFAGGRGARGIERHAPLLSLGASRDGTGIVAGAVMTCRFGEGRARGFAERAVEKEPIGAVAGTVRMTVRRLEFY